MILMDLISILLFYSVTLLKFPLLVLIVASFYGVEQGYLLWLWDLNLMFWPYTLPVSNHKYFTEVFKRKQACVVDHIQKIVPTVN